MVFENGLKLKYNWGSSSKQEFFLTTQKGNTKSWKNQNADIVADPAHRQHWQAHVRI